MSEIGIWSYDVNATSDKDTVRRLVGDTVQGLAWLWDEEILAELAQVDLLDDPPVPGSQRLLVCAIRLLESQTAQSSSMVDYSVGGSGALKTDQSQRAVAFRAAAKTLRQRLMRHRLRPQTWSL